jgi:hypothetical protein
VTAALGDAVIARSDATKIPWGVDSDRV